MRNTIKYENWHTSNDGRNLVKIGDLQARRFDHDSIVPKGSISLTIRDAKRRKFTIYIDAEKLAELGYIRGEK